MNKGIVMEIGAKRIVVMTSNGKFEAIPRRSRNCEIGEEILYSDPVPRTNPRKVAWMSSAVAAVVFCFVLFAGMTDVFADKEVVAYVTMDINPSVEIGIDAKEKVRELRGLNDDGQTLVKSLDFSGKKLADLTEELLQRADDKYLSADSADIVIASTVVKDGAKVDDEGISSKLKLDVEMHLAKIHPKLQYDVMAFAAPKEAREEAKANGLSTGKYAVYLSAKDSGDDVDLEEFKTKSIREIAKEVEGVGKILEAGKVDKSAIQQLVLEEKDGTLDKNQDDKQKGKKKDDDQKAVKPTSKSTLKPTMTPRPSPNRSPEPTKKGGKNEKDGATPPRDNKNDNRGGNGNGNGNGNNGNNGNNHDNGNNGNNNSNGKNEDKRTDSQKPSNDQGGGKSSADPASKPGDDQGKKDDGTHKEDKSSNGKNDGKQDDKQSGKKDDGKDNISNIITGNEQQSE